VCQLLKIFPALCEVYEVIERHDRSANASDHGLCWTNAYPIELAGNALTLGLCSDAANADDGIERALPD